MGVNGTLRKEMTNRREEVNYQKTKIDTEYFDEVDQFTIIM